MHPAPTIVYEVISEPKLVLTVQLQASPRDDEWSRYLDVVFSQGRERLAWSTLVVSHGGRPSRSQIAQLQQRAATSKPAPVAMVTDSPAIRFIVSALSLLNPRLRAFRLSDLELALEYMQVPSARRQLVRDTLVCLETALRDAQNVAA